MYGKENAIASVYSIISTISTPVKFASKSAAVNTTFEGPNVSWDVLDYIFRLFLYERDIQGDRVAFTRYTLQPTLRAASNVCRFWYDVATNHLYREIYLSSRNAAIRLTRSLDENSHLRPLVRQYYLSFPLSLSSRDVSIDRRSVPKDCFNEETLYKLCPRLLGVRQRVEKISLLSRLIKLDIRHITHLELAGQGIVTNEGWIFFPPSIELPILQSLTISSKKNRTVCVWNERLQWFRMPQLRHLRLSGPAPLGWRRFTLPEHSPFINTLEFIDVKSRIIRDLFDTYDNPLDPVKKTLEVLTITCLDPTKWLCERASRSLRFLENLKELSISFHLFAVAPLDIEALPPRLTKLAIVGEEGFSYCVELNLLAGLFRLCRVLWLRREKASLMDLRHVELQVKDVEKHQFLFHDTPGLDLKLGCKWHYDSDRECSIYT
ncbi:hypothetical protein ACEPAG_4264 [Sanghuangporus baumii]